MVNTQTYCTVLLVDQGPWARTDPVKGRGGAINVTGLQPGKKYTFRVVGLNGIGDTTRETRSDPHTVQVGPDHSMFFMFVSRLIHMRYHSEIMEIRRYYMG